MTSRVALVTGGTGGIGTAICKKLADMGHKVATNYRNEEKARAWQAQMKADGYEFALVKGDVTSPDEAQAMVKEVEQTLGPVEVLVNNAGITRDGTFHKMSATQWGDVINTNLNSVFNVTRPVIDGMRERKWGRIIQISSINGLKGQYGQANYAAAKAGMHGFTISLARENAKLGITVNTVSPGYVATDMVTEFNLDRMFALMEELGNPQSKYPIFHVAGTKGKGSVSALCASGLKVAGYKVGLYTSPHLLDFCERIQVDGEPISHQLLVELVEEIKPAVAKIPKLTTFEITTALGFLAFARQGCNAAVIEVGLGGRLDATNIVTPRVSVITSLSYDHMAVLGDTLAKIAGEKAGIIKRGVPVVSSSQKEEALEVFERIAKLEESSFILVGKDIKFEKIDLSLDGQSLRLVYNLRPLTFDLQLPLLGSHQLENAATAYAALKVSGLEISEQELRSI